MAFISSASAQVTVKVVITATVPKDTDEKAKLYLAGNLKEVGDWKADGVKMTRKPDGTYSVEITLPKGQTLEYKITCGSWETVEKSEKGEEIGNRTLKLDADKEEKITVKTWAKKGAAGAAAHTISGNVRTFDEFPSKVLPKRTILIWLPPGYDSDSTTRYPVLYLHDGQNCFDAATSFAGEWRADETAGKLIAEKKIKPIIMVAIANGGLARVNEYTPTPDAKVGSGGKGELYARYLIEDVKPVIDSHFRTLTGREHTAVAGSSLGGLISLYLGYKHGEVFSMCGVISPSLFWDNSQLLNAIQQNPQPLKREKIWLDMGTAEGAGDGLSKSLVNADTLAGVMKSLGMKDGADYVSRRYEGAHHNEEAWAARFGEVLTFFFASK